MQLTVAALIGCKLFGLRPAKALPSLISNMVTPEARGGNAGPAYPTEPLLQSDSALFQPFLPLPKPIF